jgi:hypothetical protein
MKYLLLLIILLTSVLSYGQKPSIASIDAALNNSNKKADECEKLYIKYLVNNYGLIKYYEYYNQSPSNVEYIYSFEQEKYSRGKIGKYFSTQKGCDNYRTASNSGFEIGCAVDHFEYKYSKCVKIENINFDETDTKYKNPSIYESEVSDPKVRILKSSSNSLNKISSSFTTPEFKQYSVKSLQTKLSKVQNAFDLDTFVTIDNNNNVKKPLIDSNELDELDALINSAILDVGNNENTDPNEGKITIESIQSLVTDKNRQISEDNAKKHYEIGIASKEAFNLLPEKIYIASSYLHHLKSLSAIKGDIGKMWESTMQEMADNIENMAIDELTQMIQVSLSNKLVSSLSDKSFKGQIIDVKTFEKVSDKSKDLFSKTSNYSEKTLSIKKEIVSQESLAAWKEAGELMLAISIDISKSSKYAFKASPYVKISLVTGKLVIYGSVYCYAKGKNDKNIMEKESVNQDIRFANIWLGKMEESFDCLNAHQIKNDYQSFGKHIMDNNCFDCQLNINSITAVIDHLFTWMNDMDKRGFSIVKSAELYQKRK